MESSNEDDAEQSGLTLFDMPRVHNKDYWRFIKLIAPSPTEPTGRKWTSSDALGSYCTRCKESLPFTVGSSHDVRKHMRERHPKDLSSLDRAEAGNVVRNALASKRSAAPFLSPTKRAKKMKPDEEEMATRLFTEWIGSCLRPLSVAEDPQLRFFLTYIQSINGLYVVPSRRTVTDRMRGYAEEMRQDLKEMIASSSSQFYSLTSDIWTSRATESYIALTIHFVTDDFELISRTLEVVSFPGIHSGERIASKLQQLIDDWGLDRNYLAKIVRDSGTNMISACEILGAEHFSCVAHSLHLVVSGALLKSHGEVTEQIAYEEQQSSENSGVTNQESENVDDDDDEWIEEPEIEIAAIGSLESELSEVLAAIPSADVRSLNESINFEIDDSLDDGLVDGCLSQQTAARLTDVMQQAMANTRRHVARFRKIAVYFRRSAKGKAKLKSFQANRVPVGAIGDVATRWNSTHAMIRRLLLLQPELNKFVDYLKTSAGRSEFSDVKMTRPTGEMWLHIQCLDKLLASFDGATKALSGANYPTITLVMPCLRILEKKLKDKDIFAKLGHEGEPYRNSVLKRMHLVRRLFLVLLRKRFKDIPQDIKFSCLLDPQFSRGTFFADEEKENGKQFIINEALRLAGADATGSGFDTSYVASSDDEDDFMWELVGQCQSSQFDLDEPEIPSNPSLREDAAEEVTRYFQIAPPPIQKKQKKQKKKDKPTLANALVWWKANASSFPLLSAVAKKYLGIVATSVPSERCFSSAGNIVTARRSNLTGANVRDIVFMHNNLPDRTKEMENDVDGPNN